MHVIGLRYADDPGNSFVRIVVEHVCVNNDWKMDLKAWYVDRNNVTHSLENWTPREIDREQWLELNIDVGSDGQSTILSAKNLATGQTYSKEITTLLGTRSGPVEIEVQYRHNERSSTDFADFRLEPALGFNISLTCMSPYGCEEITSGSQAQHSLTVTSLRLFSGSVVLSTSCTPSPCGGFPLDPTSLSVSSGGQLPVLCTSLMILS